MSVKNKLSTFYFLFLAGTGIYYTFLSVFFKQELLMTESQIGLFWSVAPLLALISSPISGALADIYKNTKLIISLLVVTAALLISSVNMLSGVTVIAVLVAFEFLRAPIMPLTDSYIISLTRVYDFSYSPIRTMGSLGWIVGSLVIARFMGDNLGMIFMVSGILLMIGLIVLSRIPNSKTSSPKANYKEDFKKLIVRKDYLLILLILSTTYSLSNAINTFNGLRIVELGGTFQHVSYATLTLAFFELIVLPLNEKLLDRFGFTKLFLIGATFMLLRWVISGSSDSYWVYIFATLLHGLSFGIIFPTALNYIAMYMNEEMNATALAIANSSYLITVSIMSYVIGGVYFALSFQHVMYIFMGIGILSYFFIYIFNKVKENNPI